MTRLESARNAAKARAKALSPERRREIAILGGRAKQARLSLKRRRAWSKKANEARWGKAA